jgi:hypothetical protein
MGICVSNRKNIIRKEPTYYYSTIYIKKALILGNKDNLGYLVGESLKNLKFDTVLVNDSFDNCLNHYLCNEELNIKQAKLTNCKELKKMFNELYKEKIIYSILVINNLDIIINSEFLNIIIKNKCINKYKFHIFIITNKKANYDNIPDNITFLEVLKNNNGLNKSKIIKFITLFIKILYNINIPKLEIG